MKCVITHCVEQASACGCGLGWQCPLCSAHGDAWYRSVEKVRFDNVMARHVHWMSHSSTSDWACIPRAVAALADFIRRVEAEHRSTTEREKLNAAQARVVQGNGISQHQDGDGRGEAAEAGGGDRTQQR